MISLQVVHSTLAVDIEKMKVDFIHGYRPSVAVFYVSTIDFSGMERFVTDANRKTWNKQWRRHNQEFEDFLGLHPELHSLSNKFFLHMGW